MSAQQEATSTAATSDESTTAKSQAVKGKSDASASRTKKKAGPTVNKRLDGANAMPFPASSKRTRVEAPDKSKNESGSATTDG